MSIQWQNKNNKLTNKQQQMWSLKWYNFSQIQNHIVIKKVLKYFIKKKLGATQKNDFKNFQNIINETDCKWMLSFET